MGNTSDWRYAWPYSSGAKLRTVDTGFDYKPGWIVIWDG